MKIIFSPSKTQTSRTILHGNSLSQKTLFQESAAELIQKIREFSQDDLKRIFKTSDKITQEVFDMYHSGEGVEGQAIASFTGTSFGQLGLDSYSQEDCEFAQDHVLILSGLYGVLKSFDSIREYRLDMNDRIFGEGDTSKNLYHFWKNNIHNYFEELLEDEETILNLASGEYSKMLSADQRDRMVTVEFLTKKENKFKSISVFAKQQRGKMLNWIIKHKITDLSQIDQYESDGFEFDSELSSEKRRVFIKSV